MSFDKCKCSTTEYFYHHGSNPIPLQSFSPTFVPAIYYSVFCLCCLHCVSHSHQSELKIILEQSGFYYRGFSWQLLILCMSLRCFILLWHVFSSRRVTLHRFLKLLFCVSSSSENSTNSNQLWVLEVQFLSSLPSETIVTCFREQKAHPGRKSYNYQAHHI